MNSRTSSSVGRLGLPALSLAMFVGLAGQAAAQTTPFSQPFGNNDIVLARRESNNLASVSLDNYRITSGAGSSAVLTYVQTLNLPSGGPGAYSNNADNNELRLNQYQSGGTTSLTLVGYNVAPLNSFDITGASTTVNRIVANVSQSGAITTNTFITPVSFNATAGSTKSPVTSAVTNDGVNYFVSADLNRGGVTRIAAGTTGSGTTQTSNFVGSGGLNANALKFRGNELFAVGGTAGGDNTVYQINYSTSSTGTATALPGITGVAGVRFVDIFFAGDNTIYLSDDGGNDSGFIGGLYRYDFNGTTWVQKYKINASTVTDGAGLLSGFRDLSGSYDPATGRVDIYAVNASNNVGHLFGITDFLSNTTSTGATIADLTGSNTFGGVWKGVEFVVPAPSAVALLALGGCATLRRRRK